MNLLLYISIEIGAIIFIESHTKSIDWKYEEKYRLVKIWFPETPQTKDRIFIFPDDFIDEVILDLEISKDDENEIKELCFRKKIKLFKVK